MNHVNIWVSDWGDVRLYGSEVISAQIFAEPAPRWLSKDHPYFQRRNDFYKRMDDRAKGIVPWEDPVL